MNLIPTLTWFTFLQVKAKIEETVNEGALLVKMVQDLANVSSLKANSLTGEK